jgi:hypothetical protein
MSDIDILACNLADHRLHWRRAGKPETVRRYRININHFTINHSKPDRPETTIQTSAIQPGQIQKKFGRKYQF